MNWFIQRKESLFMCDPPAGHTQGWPCRLCSTGKRLKNACVLQTNVNNKKEKEGGERMKKKGQGEELGRDRQRKRRKRIEWWFPVKLLTCWPSLLSTRILQEILTSAVSCGIQLIHVSNKHSCANCL